MNYSITYYLRKGRSDKQGRVTIYMRITVNGNRTQMSTGEKVHPDNWETKTHRVIGKTDRTTQINKHLQHLEDRVREARNYLVSTDQPVTPASLKARLHNDDGRLPELMLMKRFLASNDRIKSLIGKDYSKSTHLKYERSRVYFYEFLKSKYNKSDIPVDKLNLQMIEEYEVFLKTERDLAHNTALKHIKRLKTIVLDALKKNLIRVNPFVDFKRTRERVIPTRLSHEELSRIENREFEMESLERARDVFVFCCYTGLAFSDAKTLRYHHFETDKAGEKWLIKSRIKTDEPARILLLPKPKEIIEKYRDYESAYVDKRQVLPTVSNARANTYLKEVATLARVKKRLTTHVARHTFATTVCLENGLPLESVQVMLGHKAIESTEIYAEVTNYKLGKEMTQLRQQLA